jgi:hypothetical protein
MAISNGKHLVHEVAGPGIKVVRFLRPDLRAELDPIVNDDNGLFREIQSSVLNSLAEHEAVIFNFGLIERFPTAFFQLMIRVRQAVHAKHGRVYLCAFRPEILPGVELMQGRKLFEITSGEEQALHMAKAR